MFRFSSSRKDKKKSWILDFITGSNDQIKGQIVKVCRHISGPDKDGVITKQVSDNAVFIRAIFTQEAIANYSFDEDLCTPPEWDQALLIIKKYDLIFLPAESLEDCQFALAIKKFSLLDLSNGIESKNPIYDCMSNPLVQKAAAERWNQYITNRGNTEDSQMLGSQLSILIEAMGSEVEESQPGSQQPSTSSSKDEKKKSSQGLWESWQKLKQKISIKNWIIPQSQQESLAAIEEWKEDYIPPPSASDSRSSSGDAVFSQLAMARSDKDRAVPDVFGDGAAPSQNQTVKEVDKKKDDTKRRSVENESLPAENSVGNRNESENQKEKNLSESSVSEESPRTAEMSKKIQDENSDKNESDGISKLPGMMGKKWRVESSKSCPEKTELVPKTPVRSQEGKLLDFDSEYHRFLDSSREKTTDEMGIKIVEVFTLENLPTAWHDASPESIQLSCPSQSDSQEVKDCSQEVKDCSQDVKDFSQSAHSVNYTTNVNSEHYGDNIVLSEDPLCENASNEINPQPNPSVGNTGESKEVDGDGLQKVSTGSEVDNKLIDDNQKSSTPAKAQRKRVTSFFNKSMEASRIERESASSETMRTSSVGETFESAVFQLDVDPSINGPPDQKHNGGTEHDRKRVSFAPSVMTSSLGKRNSNDIMDCTGSSCSVYIDAKSHLSSPDLADYPMSQPFVPATEDLLALHTSVDDDTGILISSQEPVDKSRDSFGSRQRESTDNICMEGSYHHSTQSSAAAPARPDLSISPIREDDKGHHESNSASEESQSILISSGEGNSEHAVCVIPETELFGEESNSKQMNSLDKYVEKSKIAAPIKGKSYLNNYCDQHPSFAESGSEEQIPLSGSVNSFQVTGNKELTSSCIKQNKQSPTQSGKQRGRRSGTSRSQPGIPDSDSKSSKEVYALSSRSLRSHRRQVLKENDESQLKKSDLEQDSIEIEEYTTSSSELEDHKDKLEGQSKQCQEKNCDQHPDTVSLGIYQKEQEKEQNDRNKDDVPDFQDVGFITQGDGPNIQDVDRDTQDEDLNIQDTGLNTQDAVMTVLAARAMVGDEDIDEESQENIVNDQDAELLVLEKDGLDTVRPQHKEPELNATEQNNRNTRTRKQVEVVPEKSIAEKKLREKSLSLKSRKRKPVLTEDASESNDLDIEIVKEKTRSSLDNSCNNAKDGKSLVKDQILVEKRFVTTRRKTLKKQSPPEKSSEENALSVLPIKRKLTTSNDQGMSGNGSSISKYRRKSDENVPYTHNTKPVEVIEIEDENDNDHLTVRNKPNTEIVKMMNETLKRLHKGTDTKRETRRYTRTSSADKNSKRKVPDSAAGTSTSSTGARSRLSSSVIEGECEMKTPSVEMLLNFLNVKPLDSNPILNHRMSSNMSNKIYQIFQKPICYPEH